MIVSVSKVPLFDPSKKGHMIERSYFDIKYREYYRVFQFGVMNGIIEKDFFKLNNNVYAPIELDLIHDYLFNL